ncbi:MAG TPA: hypothetical protein ENN91_04305, partial [Firmicutes bacterium]|nr:hypothetical protein [Bacillota bacterium]
MHGVPFDFAGRFRLVIVFGLSISLAVPLISGFRFNGLSLLLQAAITALIMAVLSAVYLFPILKIIIPFLLVSAAAIFYLVDPVFAADTAASLLQMPQPSNSVLWPLIYTIAVTTLVFQIVFRSIHFLPLLLLIGAGTFLPLWYFYIDSAFPAAIIYSALWLMLLSYDRGSRFWSRVEQREDPVILGEIRRRWLVYTAGILSVALLISLTLPKEIAPIRWPVLQQWTTDNFPFLRQLREAEPLDTRGEGKEFDLYLFTVSESKDLGGPFRQDETALIEVEARGGMYLRGGARDLYTGRQWLNSRDTTGPAESHLPSPDRQAADSLEKVKITVSHLRLRTVSIFTMLYPQNLPATLPGSLLKDGNGNLILSQAVPLDYKYRIEGYDRVYRIDYAAGEQEEDFSALARYFALPEEMPGRVGELAREITGGRKSFYNRMKALESHLRLNYSYNTEMPFLPEGRDYVDYFLFDLKEGYCTAFASALAVMGRAAGVPTRYVVGFVVPDEDEPVDRVARRLSGSDAHAWVEAYIPGFGWLPFEATPGFRNDDFLPVASRPRDYPAGHTEGREERNLSMRRREPREERSDLPRASAEPADIAPEYGKILTAGLAIAAAVFLSLLVSLMFRRYRQIYKNLRILDQSGPAHKAIIYYTLSLALLKRIKLSKEPGETPHEYSRRIIREIHAWNV